MAQFKEDTDAILADENEDMDEKTHEELVKMRDEGKFACVEDFAKEVLEFLITQNKAITYRDTVKAGKDCQDGNVADKAIIDGVALIRTVAEYML